MPGVKSTTRYNGYYALYAGDEYIYGGTIDELARWKGVPRHYIVRFLTPKYRCETLERKKKHHLKQPPYELVYVDDLTKPDDYVNDESEV